jgi:hypothetical protein
MFPSLTRPFYKTVAEIARSRYETGEAVGLMYKAGGDAVKVHALSGELQLSSSGWGLLKVPNALIRGAFDALDEHGAQLPLRDGRLNGHVSVFRPEELDQIGGADKVHEWGHHFRYTLGPIKEVEPAGWPEMSKVWFIEIASPDLAMLRKSYGLTPFPKHPFHATIAVRKKGVLYENSTTKTEEKSGAAPQGRDAGVQLLAGDGGALREKEAQAVQGLRRSRDTRLSEVAEQFHGLLGGHGAEAAGARPGEAQKRAWVRAGELLLDLILQYQSTGAPHRPRAPRGDRRRVQGPDTESSIMPAVGTATGAYGLSQLLMRTKDPIADKVLGPAPWRNQKNKKKQEIV